MATGPPTFAVVERTSTISELRTLAGERTVRRQAVAMRQVEFAARRLQEELVFGTAVTLRLAIGVRVAGERIRTSMQQLALLQFAQQTTPQSVIQRQELVTTFEATLPERHGGFRGLFAQPALPLLQSFAAQEISQQGPPGQQQGAGASVLARTTARIVPRQIWLRALGLTVERTLAAFRLNI